MGFVTKQQVFDKTRILLGDSEVSGGQIYTDDGASGTINLNSLLATVNSEALRHMQELENRFVIRDFFAALVPFQAYLDPASVSVVDVGEIREVRARSITATLDIAAVTPNLSTSVCRVQTSAAHGLADGNLVVVTGSVGGISNILGEWIVDVVSADEFDIHGCRASGTYTSGGQVVDPSGNWSDPLVHRDYLNLESGKQNEYNWSQDVLRFVSSSQARLIKVEYKISGTLPAADADSLAPDDMADYFCYRLAGLAAEADGDYETAQRMQFQAIGPNPDEPSGFLGQILDNGVKAMNKTVYQFGRFRERRHFAAGLVR